MRRQTALRNAEHEAVKDQSGEDGMERTYTFKTDGQSVRCEPTDIGLLTTMVKLTGSTFYCQPGAR